MKNLNWFSRGLAIAGVFAVTSASAGPVVWTDWTSITTGSAIGTLGGVTVTATAKIEELIEELPQFNIREYLDKLRAAFAALSFVPLDDVWAQGLRDLFKDMDD